MFQEITTVHCENHMKPKEYTMFTKCGVRRCWRRWQI